MHLEFFLVRYSECNPYRLLFIKRGHKKGITTWGYGHLNISISGDFSRDVLDIILYEIKGYSSMKVFIIGGSRGVGEDITNYFAPNSFSVSRENGYDINDPDHRLKIASLSLDYDIVVNHAYSRNLSQSDMLQDLYGCWAKNDKNGYIFNTGSAATWHVPVLPNVYSGIKKITDTLCKQMSKQVENNNVRFKVTNIRTGRLDTEKSRKLKEWAGNGVRGEDIAKTMEFFYRLPEDVTIPDFVMIERCDN